MLTFFLRVFCLNFDCILFQLFSIYLLLCIYIYQIVYLPNLRNRFMNNDRILLLEILYSNFKVALCSVRPIVLILKCFAQISTRQYRKLLGQYTALIILISICIRCISKQEIPIDVFRYFIQKILIQFDSQSKTYLLQDLEVFEKLHVRMCFLFQQWLADRINESRGQLSAHK